MHSHWTNPTIVRRHTIAAVSAAALLVACDQPAGLSRPGGGILAAAQAGTVSAHGSGTVSGFSEGTGFNAGGKGVKFSFDFSGPNTFTTVVPVSGTWSASDPETGVQLLFTIGTASVSPEFHSISVSGTCEITTPDGRSLPGSCTMSASDNTSNGATDRIAFHGSAGNGTIIGDGELASGNINID